MTTKNGTVLAVCISEIKGVPKKNIMQSEVLLTGLKGDAHAGDWHRQVSLLAVESIDKVRKLGLHIEFGAFAENITTSGLDLHHLPSAPALQLMT